MLPLVAIATSLLPELIQIIAGDKAGTVATDIANAVKTVTGTSDPVAAKQAVNSDPAVAANLQAQLAQIAITASQAQYAEADKKRQDQLNALQQQIANTQDARKNLVTLASDKSLIAWVAPVVSILVMGGFYVLLYVLVTKPAASAAGSTGETGVIQLLNICIGALVAAFSTVVNFWLGSSKGSQDKDQANLQIQSNQSQALQTQATQATAALHSATISAAAAGAAAAQGAGGAGTAGGVKTDASTNFTACLAVVLAGEGGYTNNPADPGGPTNFGITLKDLQEFTGNPNLTATDVQNMSKAIAQEIYRSRYWNPMQCGDLPNGVDLQIFDFGVLAGVRESIKALQKVVGVTVDGSIGPITLAAAKAADPRTLVQNITPIRMDYLRSCSDWPTFQNGWTNRTNTVERTALKMVGAGVPVA